MTPRATGILGMVAATIVIVWCAVLIATPPFSILGAVGLVGGAILFAIAASLTVRKSWRKTSWPEVRVHIVDSINVKEPTALEFAISFVLAAVGWIVYGVVLLIFDADDAWTNIWIGVVFACLALLVSVWIVRKRRAK